MSVDQDDRLNEIVVLIDVQSRKNKSLSSIEKSSTDLIRIN
jgi:hypothetical protein